MSSEDKSAKFSFREAIVQKRLPPPAVLPIDPGHNRDSPDFPKVFDEDKIQLYPNVFSLYEWMAHNKSPWNDKYLAWGYRRLKRERARLVQALVTAIFEVLDNKKPHRDLSDPKKFQIRQAIVDCGGFRKLLFQARVIPDNQTTPVTPFNPIQAIAHFKKLLEVLIPQPNSHEMDYFYEQLSEYPRTASNHWMKLLLCNYPFFWDGYERRSFYINFYYRSKTDRSGVFAKIIQGVYYVDFATTLVPYWQEGLEGGSIYEDVLLERRYKDADLGDALRFIRAVLHHLKETQDRRAEAALHENEVEAYLSSKFSMVIVKVYQEMCKVKTYFS